MRQIRTGLSSSRQIAKPGAWPGFLILEIGLLVRRGSAGKLFGHSKFMRGADSRALRIQKAFAARSETKLDEGARIWDDLGLPTVIALELRKRRLGVGIKRASRFAVHVSFAYQGRLDFAGAIGVDGLLTARLFRFLSAGGILCRDF